MVDIIKKDLLEKISKKLNKPLVFIKGVYMYGSRVYKTDNSNSDWDFIVIANASVPEAEYNFGKYNIHVITPETFEKYAINNHIKAVECLFAPEFAVIKPYPFDFKYIEKRFRHNISHTVSNSWVKCKKKLKQGDYYIGIKSLFHSLRIADFGIQMAKKGEIDFSSMNHIWDELNSKTWTWEELNKEFKPMKNSLMTEFRENCSKL